MRDAPEGIPAARGTLLPVASHIPCTSAAFAELSAEVLRSGRALRFRANGSSMAPLVRDGDVVLVRPVGPRLVRTGDVVLCIPGAGPSGVLVHRVIGTDASRERCRFTIQGDAVPQPDGTIPAAQVYGRVVTIERGGVPIELDRPVMRLLGWLAVLRSRWNLARGGRLWRARRLIKRLPGLSRYLA